MVAAIQEGQINAMTIQMVASADRLLGPDAFWSVIA